MLTADAAWDAICAAVRPLPERSVPLAAALGGYLAGPVCADRDIPPADRSAMDGFAVRACDAASVPASLRVIGEVAAGSESNFVVGEGECARIYTGANIPPGADTVIRVEDTAQRTFAGNANATEATIVVSVPKGSNIFRKGENARRGQELLPIGVRLGPTQLGIAAACGYGQLLVRARPKIAMLATGAELLDESAPAPGTHQIRDSNTPMIVAACHLGGADVVRQRAVPDDLAATQDAIADAAATAGAIVLTGGVSMGDRDYVRPALDEMGADVRYHGIAIRPGRPQLFALLPRGVPVFGLPGNPLSAAVGLYEFVLPALRLLAGCPIADCRPLLHLPLAAPAGKQGPWTQVIPAVIRTDARGTTVHPRVPAGSADLVTAGCAEGAIILPPDAGRAEAGQIVAFRPWGSVFRA